MQFNSPLLNALRRAARDDRGSQLVETALTLLVLMGLILGVIQGSMAVYSYHYLANAAHEATRYAIVRGTGWGTSCASYGSSQCTASADNIRNWVANRGFPGINITPSEVYVSYFSTPQTSTSMNCSDGSTTPLGAGNIVQVTICYPYTFSLPAFGTYTYHLGSTSQMMIAQ
ncbi:MAG TPA: TadE/TadG family type IV pilus assembly protein [Terracidiphilus sp.]